MLQPRFVDLSEAVQHQTGSQFRATSRGELVCRAWFLPLKYVFPQPARWILSWILEKRLGGGGTCRILRGAVVQLNDCREHAIVIAGSGSENVNGAVDDLLDDEELTRVLAQVEVTFSNSGGSPRSRRVVAGGSSGARVGSPQGTRRAGIRMKLCHRVPPLQFAKPEVAYWFHNAFPCDRALAPRHQPTRPDPSGSDRIQPHGEIQQDGRVQPVLR